MSDVPLFDPRPRLRRFAVAACAVLGGCTATGQPDVSALLDATDRSLIAETTRVALEENKVGQSSNWTNPANGHLGTVTPVRTFKESAGRPCRDFQQTATADGRTIFAFDRACRRDNGEWFSAGYGSLSGAVVSGGARYSYAREPYPPRYYDDPFCRWPYYDPFCSPYPRTSLWHRYGYWH